MISFHLFLKQLLQSVVLGLFLLFFSFINLGLLVVFRFTGYCPQLKYNMGKSYGQLTSEMLSRPQAECSTHPVFRGRGPTVHSDAAVTLKMIHGYTGRYHTLTQRGQ